MLEGFKKFILRGNVVELAVAVIMGAAFGGIVKSMVEDIITPLLGLLGGTPDFSGLLIPNTNIMIGKFINAVINFIIQAAVVYFIIVMPMNKLMARLQKQDPKTIPEPSPEVKLLAEIRDLLKSRNEAV